MTEKITFDPTHTNFGFSTKHLGVSTVRGSFKTFGGEFEGDAADLSSFRGSAHIEVASLTTGTEQRDGHLLSGDFFEAETYPRATYVLTGIRALGTGRYAVTGDLTIKNVTKALVLEAEVDSEIPDPFGSGGRRVGVTFTGKLNRLDYGLNWDGLAGAIPLAGHDIKLLIETELVAVPVEAGAASA